MTISTFRKIITAINYKTVYFNLKHFALKDAIKFPVLLSNRVTINKNVGKVVLEGPIRPGLIKIGFGEVGIFDRKRSRTILQLSGILVFKGAANIGHGSKIVVSKEAAIVFGKNVIITAESAIVATKRIEIGDNSLFSWDILIMDTDFHKIKNQEGTIVNEPAEIKIGKNVWIGCRSLVLKGANIPDNSIIAASSLVARSLEGEGNVFGGNPIKIIKSNVTWEP